MRLWYELDERNEPVPIDDLDELCKKRAAGARLHEHVGDTQAWGFIRVSSVFLGLDHRHVDRETLPPILFETMIFGGPLDGVCQRYCTWAEAEHGHRRYVVAAWLTLPICPLVSAWRWVSEKAWWWRWSRKYARQKPKA